MGGNKRFHTAVIRNRGNASGVQEMRDSNGNLIRIPEGKNVGRDNRTNTTMGNARERMLNAKAIQEVRDTAKQIRAFSKKWATKKINMDNAKELIREGTQAQRNLEKLARIANQVHPSSADAVLWPSSHTQAEIDNAKKNIERILGVKLS